MLSTRSRDSLGPLALMFAIVLGVLALYARIAHADPVIAVTPTGIALGWQVWLVAILAAAGGAIKILDVLIAGLRWLAPRTPTKLDDTARDDLKIVRDDIAWVLKLLGALVPATEVPTPATDRPTLTISPPPRNTQAGRARLGMLTAIALIGAALAGMAMIGCTASQARQVTATGVVAALDCEAAHLDAQALADAKVFAAAFVQRWIAGTGATPSSVAIRADLAPIKSDLGRCAITGALAAATAIVAPTPGTATSALTAGPDPIAVRAAFAVAARQLGWPAVRVAAGSAGSVL